MLKTFIALLFTVSVCFSNLSAVDIQDVGDYDIETPATHNFYKREDSVLLKVSYEF